MTCLPHLSLRHKHTLPLKKNYQVFTSRNTWKPIWNIKFLEVGSSLKSSVITLYTVIYHKHHLCMITTGFCILPHLQDQGKVFCIYSTIHKSCHYIYFLNSPCPFPREKREKVSKDNTVKNRQQMTKDSHFCSHLIPKTIIIFISLNIQKERYSPDTSALHWAAERAHEEC